MTCQYSGNRECVPTTLHRKVESRTFLSGAISNILTCHGGQNAPPASSVNFEACESSSTNKRLKKEKIARTQVEHPNMQLKLHSERLKKGKMFQQEVLYLRTSRGAQFLQKTKQLTSDVI